MNIDIDIFIVNILKAIIIYMVREPQKNGADFICRDKLEGS